jgi:hypothetical protein
MSTSRRGSDPVAEKVAHQRQSGNAIVGSVGSLADAINRPYRALVLVGAYGGLRTRT